MVVLEDPELTSSHVHTKFIAIYRSFPSEKDGKLDELFSTTKDKKTTLRWVGDLG